MENIAAAGRKGDNLGLKKENSIILEPEKALQRPFKDIPVEELIGSESKCLNPWQSFSMLMALGSIVLFIIIGLYRCCGVRSDDRPPRRRGSLKNL